MTTPKPDPILVGIEKILLALIDEISSIRAGKTFTPTDYTKAPLKAIYQLILNERKKDGR